jgi:hypothetical protein
MDPLFYSLAGNLVSLALAAAAALAWAKERGRADDLEDANTDLLKANRELREERDTATGAYRELKRAVIAKAPAKRVKAA